MEGIKIFENSEFGAVRVVDVNGEPWFVASDIAKALGYVDPAQAVRDNCKKVNKITQQVSETFSVHTPPRNILIIPESDVYRLIMRSNLKNEDVERFQTWVVEEVLPAIRKTGGYGQWNLPRVPKSFPDALRMIADIEEEKQLALEQRDYYKRTKAEIGSRREATAMVTASAAVRQRDALADQLGEGKHYKQVKAIPWLLEVFHESAGMYSQVGRKLSQLGERMGLSPRIKEDSQYGTIKIHHVEVIEALRLALKQDHNLLGKYRKQQ